MQDLSTDFVARIKEAASTSKPLRLRGGGTKDFYGQVLVGEVLDTRGHTGILEYEPTELVITARAGTPLREIEAALAEKGQMLAFEPPHFGDEATVGGAIASGLSGPRRATVGAARDFVLGVKIADGRGEIQTFGGQVMKNVAGYDVSRLLAGSLGTLGLLLEVSVKVLPRPVQELSLRMELPEAQALDKLNRWAGQPIPISASCWRDGLLSLRLSGARAAVDKARSTLGGEIFEAGDDFWRGLREQTDGFFDLAAEEILWRLSLPSTTQALGLAGESLMEWGGAQRWLKTSLDASALRRLAAALGGHATLYRGGSALERKAMGVFQPLPASMAAIQRRLKQAFDPAGIFNPGRMYP
jgi:glycolate oxidase FAD binding subunit